MNVIAVSNFFSASRMAQSVLNIDAHQYGHSESIAAYSNLLAQYSSNDEDFNTNEIFKILSKKLASLTLADFEANEESFLKIFDALDKHPRIGKLLLKHFVKNHNLLFDNTFYLICHLMLCSIPRFQNEAVILFSASLTKLWNFYEPIDKNGWLKSMVKNHVLISIREKIILILQVLKKRNNTFACFAPGLQRIALELIQSDNRKQLNVRLNEGRLQEISSQIGFLGRRIFVEVAVLNTCALDQQLAMLINAVFASSNSVSIAYVLIDVLLELTIRAPVLLLNNWKVFEKLIESVCSLLNSEVSTSMIRAIMPLINQRAQLRALLLKTMKAHMLNTSKMLFALPIILILLKSLSNQPSVKQTTQLSQSFATFSTQILNEIGLSRQSEQSIALEVFGFIKRCINQSVQTKCLIYRGLVDICRKNSCFVVQVIDLVIYDAENLPDLVALNYVDAKRDESTLKIPLDMIAMTLSDLMRISITNREHCFPATNTTDAMTVRAELSLQKIIDMAFVNDLDALSLGGNADFGTTLQGATNYAFARLLVSFYDVLIYHLWTVEMNENDENSEENNCVIKILNLVQKRCKLQQILKEKIKNGKNNRDSEGGDDTSQNNAVAVTKKKKSANSTSGIEIETNLLDLDKMLGTLINKNNEQSKEIQMALIGWAIEHIYTAVEKLDPFSTSCAFSMSCFTSLAKSLMTFYIGDNVADALTTFSCWNILKTYAIVSYANIVKYLTTRYQHRSQTALIKLISAFPANADDSTGTISSTFNAAILSSAALAESAQTQFPFRRPELPTQNRAERLLCKEVNNGEISRANAIAYNRTLFKHLMVYANQLLPALFSIYESFQKHKMAADYQRQAHVILDLCCHFTTLMPTGSVVLQRNCLKIFNKLAKVNAIEDRLVVKELWRILFRLVAHSDYSEFYINFLNSLINEILMVTDLPEDVQAGYCSITIRNREEIMTLLMETICKILSNISLIFEIKTEMNGEFDNEFLSSVCSTTRRLTEVTKHALVFVSERENLTSFFMVVMMNVYQTIYSIAKQLEIQKLAKNYVEESSEELGELVQGPLNELVTLYSDSQLGASHENESSGIADESFSKRVRKSKKDEKIFVGHERAFEKLQVQLILISKLFDNDQLILKTIKLNTIRDFSIDSELLLKRLQRRQTSVIEKNVENITSNEIDENSQTEAIENEEDEQDEMNETINSRTQSPARNDMNNSQNDENSFDQNESINQSSGRSALVDADYANNSFSAGGGFCDQDESFDTFCNVSKRRKTEND